MKTEEIMEREFELRIEKGLAAAKKNGHQMEPKVTNKGYANFKCTRCNRWMIINEEIEGSVLRNKCIPSR